MRKTFGSVAVSLLLVVGCDSTAPRPFTPMLTVSGAGTGVVVSSPGSINCTITIGSPSGMCSGEFALSTSITLTATPALGYTVGSWVGCDAATASTCMVNIGFDRSVTATFQASTLQLRILVTGFFGKVVTSPGGTACQSHEICFANFAPGTQVTLTAMPGDGYYLYNWENCDSRSATTCTVSMTSNRSAAASFYSITAALPLTVSGAGNGSGRVTSATLGIDCTVTGGFTSGSCNYIIPPSSPVVLTASPASGSMLSGWTGCETITGSTCAFSMTAARTVTVRFTN